MFSPSPKSRSTPAFARWEFLALGLVLLFALWLRAPLISSGLPFFYNEDEAHHFNRVVNMVKEGEFNPKYFHKPSLHFYLRMPVVAASFIWNVNQGHLKKIEEIRTADRFGIAGYAFTASHPGIVKWNRAFSVLLSLVTVLLTYLIARRACASRIAGVVAAGLAAIAPVAVEHSATVGVDTLMAVMVLAAVWLALGLIDRFSLGRLFFVGAVCGLAVSSKYNAAPIALLPLIALFVCHRVNLIGLALAVLAPALGFFLGSPYILSEIPLFLNHFSYEIWHYGVAGHEGHSAEPGLAQALFYLKWMFNAGIGYGIVLLASIGIFVSLRANNRAWMLVAFFPLIYFLMMSAQRANFTRNMVVFAPFVAIYAAACYQAVVALCPRGTSIIVQLVLLLILLIQPVRQSLALRHDAIDIPESRLDVVKWLNAQHQPNIETAISGELQLAPVVWSWAGVTAISEKKNSLAELYLNGFDRVVVGPGLTESPSPLASLEQEFSGNSAYGRVVQNPQVRIYSFREPSALEVAELVTSSAVQQLSFQGAAGRWECQVAEIRAEGTGEPYCWIKSRLAELNLTGLKNILRNGSAGDTATVALEVMSPWGDQALTVIAGGEEKTIVFEPDDIGKWVTTGVSLSKTALALSDKLVLKVARIHSPKDQGMSDDTRRLGVALRHVTVAG